MNQKQLLVEKLIQANCIKIGNFTLKNGSKSKYYFDMKNLISTPTLLAEIGDLIFKMLGDFDINYWNSIWRITNCHTFPQNTINR